MHEYYAKNRAKLKKGMDAFLSLIRPELEKASGKTYHEIFEEIWCCYDTQLLEQFPYIGGDQASGTKNLTGAYYFVAMGEVLKRYGTGMEDIGHLMVYVYERYTRKLPGLARHLMGRIYRSPRLLSSMMRKKDEQNRKNAQLNPGSFETETQDTPEEGFDFSYHNLVCPLSNFARAHGYEEYMPYICNLDYVNFGLLSVPLYREHTCFQSGDYCDFKLKLDAEPLSYWPPVFRQDNPYQ
ncbi:MAG: L-2-amino-thiazoline-4-carboxylic acid hydrolase [Clostridia bacterium]|nr:L-2-amino-thiazoline-4-carboxylic acid hydrolase [Clostridia bacterium]